MDHLKNALNWTEKHLDLFFPDDPDRIKDETDLQMAGELAILYRATADSTAISAKLQARIRKELLAYIHDPIIVETARKSLGSAWAWLMPYFIMRQMGEPPHPEHEKTLALAAALGLPDAIETVPYRRLDRRYFLASNNAAGFSPGADILHTHLAQATSLLGTGREEAYSFTHTVFYLTDFGRIGISKTNPAHGKISQMVGSLLPQFARRGDWDVLGELLIVAASLDGFDAALLQGYLDLFNAAFRADGAIPASDPTARAIATETDRQKLFTACYHTTLVSVLLQVALLQRDTTLAMATLDLAPLSCTEPMPGYDDILGARNQAVTFLNEATEAGIAFPDLLPNVVAQAPKKLPPVAVCRLEREVLKEYLNVHAANMAAAQLYPLAETLARNGDIELLLICLPSLSHTNAFEARFAALWAFVLGQQTLNGSLGYFEREKIQIDVRDIEPARAALTNLFVDTCDSMLDQGLKTALG